MDVLLTSDGDLSIDGRGDIALTQSARQAIRVRLLWFFGEWRFAPGLGMPYFEEVFIKNPNLGRIRRIVRDQAMGVREVLDVSNINVVVNVGTREARVSFDVILDGETYREEVEIPWGTNMD